MKINYRIVIINFIVVLLVLPATAVLYYSILSDSLISLQKKSLSHSLNDFINSIQNFSQQSDNSFYQFYSKSFINNNSDEYYIDFVFISDGDMLKPIYLSEKFNLSSETFTLKKLKTSYSNLYVKKTVIDRKTFYYGKAIDLDFVNSLSQKINADIVLFSDKVVIEVSNPKDNQELFFVFFNAIENLIFDKKYNVYSEESNSKNILATWYKPFDIENSATAISFLIFNKLEEYSQLRDSLKNILIFIGIIGIAISVLLSYLLTIKIRKQIKQLSEATEAIKEGNFDVTVKMKGNDEFTQLSDTFNLMVGKLNKNQKLISDYSDFITLLNQNSTLKEISEIALNKIITTCNFSIGAIYLVESDEIKLLSTYGIGAEAYSNENKTILNQVIEKKNKMVLSFDNNIPSFKTGLLEIKLSHLILQPIIYSDKVVAILELVSQSPLSDESIDYLDKIQEQLAIGLINAKSILQLENLVVELQKLNEELKNSNQQISEQNEKLIRLSEILQIRTKELSTQKEKAEESTKLKSQFLARISHELKTPLNSIIGLTDLILSTSEISEHDKERLLVVQRSGKRLIDLINNLLDYSQMESGKFKPEFSDFLLGDFVDHIVFEMEPLAHQKNLKLCVNKNNLHDLTIYSDREKLYQVLVNIIGNAIKFTQEGFIEFNINKNDSNKIIFSVLDTGIGIADSEKEIIFEEFRQADGSYSRKFGGTGLGLAISKKILDMLGGKIWLESKVNMGSKFFVEIPIKNSVQISKPKENIKILLDDETIKENLILAVDDDPDSLFTLTEILNSFRLKNIVARSGVECLKILENVKPDIILLDIMMPEMDGFQTIREIKSFEKYNSIKIFAVTARAMEKGKDVLKNSGFDDFIFKPINSIELINKIYTHLNVHKIEEYEKNTDNR